MKRNGRAHGAKEIDRAYGFAQSIGFPQINIDLIAGMMGETEEKWIAVIEKAAALAPDSITLYPMEIPFNTTICIGPPASLHTHPVNTILRPLA